MKSIRLLSGRAALWLSLGVLAACGGPQRAESPADEAGAPTAAQDESEPTTLAEAEARLERAKGDLDRLALNDPGQPPAAAAPPAPATAGAAAPSSVPMPAPRMEAERAADKSAAPSASMSESDAEEAPRAKEVSACETACKAFSSLSRASDAVCRLDPDGGQRCERAKKIREDASRRVASCGCAQ